MREAMTQAARVAVQESRGRPVPPENLHLTVAFLGWVAERRLPRLIDIARAATANGPAALPHAQRSAVPLALEVTFDQLEYWPGAHLLCAVPKATPGSVAALTQRLQELLLAGGFAPDGINRVFRPHVTLARKVHRPPRIQKIQPVTWCFTDFVLVNSKTLPGGSIYAVLERLSFAG
jgi:2'-5' RNA ligase